MLLDIGSGKQHLSVSLSIFRGVFNLDTIKSLSNGGVGLVSGKNTFAWSTNGFSSFNEFLGEISRSVCFSLDGFHLKFLL